MYPLGRAVLAKVACRPGTRRRCCSWGRAPGSRTEPFLPTFPGTFPRHARPRPGPRPASWRLGVAGVASQQHPDRDGLRRSSSLLSRCRFGDQSHRTPSFQRRVRDSEAAESPLPLAEGRCPAGRDTWGGGPCWTPVLGGRWAWGGWRTCLRPFQGSRHLAGGGRLPRP